MSLFHNAITETNGVDVNVGYLSLFVILALDVLATVTLIGAGFVGQYYSERHQFPFTDAAAALAALWGTFSTALGALGLFLVGDRR